MTDNEEVPGGWSPRHHSEEPNHGTTSKATTGTPLWQLEEVKEEITDVGLDGSGMLHRLNINHLNEQNLLDLCLWNESRPRCEEGTESVDFFSGIYFNHKGNKNNTTSSIYFTIIELRQKSNTIKLWVRNTPEDNKNNTMPFFNITSHNTSRKHKKKRQRYQLNCCHSYKQHGAKRVSIVYQLSKVLFG